MRTWNVLKWNVLRWNVWIALLTLGVCAPACADADGDDAALWLRLDTTADGWLDGKELEGGWIRFDADRDGEVTRAEFIAGRRKERAAATSGTPAQDAAEFAKLDVSGNGYLSGTELDGGNARRYDADADKRVTLEEFLAGRAAERGATPPAKPPETPRPDAPPAVTPGAKVTPPAPTAMSATGITGLFYMQKYWVASRHLEKAVWYFAPDGKLHVNPERGFSAADLAHPKPQTSTYRVANGTMTVEWNDGKNPPSTAPLEFVPGGFNWDTGMYLPIKPLTDAKRLVGTYDGGVSMSLSGSSPTVAKTLVLRDGGAWALSGYSLSVTTEGGQVLTGLAIPFDDETTAIYPDRLYFGGVMFKKME